LLEYFFFFPCKQEFHKPEYIASKFSILSLSFSLELKKSFLYGESRCFSMIQNPLDDLTADCSSGLIPWPPPTHTTYFSRTMLLVVLGKLFAS
jgi:hypothetical protein